MPEQPLYPGVYVEEIASGVRPIGSLPTSLTAFVGTALRGAIDKAVPISSSTDFERIFGGLSANSEMSYGVRQYFLNGGRDALIVRIAKDALPASLILLNVTAMPVLKLSALDAGFSGNDIEVGIDYATRQPDSSFNLRLTRRRDGLSEHYADASMNSADARYLPNLLNGVSQMVTISREVTPLTLKNLPAGTSTSGVLGDVLTLLDDTHRDFRVAINGLPPVTVSLNPAADLSGRTPTQRLGALATAITLKIRNQAAGRAALSRFTCRRVGKTLVLKSGSRGELSSVRVLPGLVNDAAWVLRLGAANGGNETDAVASLRPQLAEGGAALLAGGSESPLGPAELAALIIPDRETRQGLYALDNADLFNILVLPGVTDPAVLAAAAAYCEERRAFLIIDAPATATDPARMIAAVSGPDLPKSDHAAVYFPWIYIADPLQNNERRLTPPGGTIAGLYARVDANRGVWKAPAGIDTTLTGVLGPAVALKDSENGQLNPLGVNCLRSFTTYGTVAWGARTLRGADAMGSEFKYIPIRRLALHIEESLYRGLQWVVFEPNDEPLWANIRLHVGAFLNDLFRQGAFQGTSARDAYFVKCDRETTTQADIDLDALNVQVGFAPLKPAEFVILKIQLKAAAI